MVAVDGLSKFGLQPVHCAEVLGVICKTDEGGEMSSKSTTCNVSMRRLFGAQLSMHGWVGAASVAVALAGGAGTAGAQTALTASAQNAFHEPPVFSSQNGTLDIFMNVKAKPIPTITFTSPTTHQQIHPQGFAYEICNRTFSGPQNCVWD